MPYADPEKRRDFQREYKRKWRAEKQTRKSPCLHCPRWGRLDWENICAPACDLRQEYANEVAQYNLPEARKMKAGEEKGAREMGEIMPMKPPIPAVIGEGTPFPLLPFPPKEEPKLSHMASATTENVMEAIKLLLEEKPAGVRKSDVYYLLRSDEAPINDKRGSTKTTNCLYTLIGRTMDKLTKEEHLIKTESGFGGLFTINQPPEQHIVAPLGKTLFNVDKRYRLIRKLDREGKSVEEICLIVKVSRSTVNKVLNKTKMKPKTKPAVVREAKVAPPVVSIPLAEPKRKSLRGTAAEYKERAVRIKELYAAGKNTDEIAAEIGCHRTTVNRITKRWQGPPFFSTQGNSGPRKYPPPVGVAGAAPVVVTEPTQNRPVGRPRIHPVAPLQKRPVGRPRKEIIPELPKKGFWAWIMRIAKRMMERQSQRRAQKVAKMAPEKVCPHCGEKI